MVREPNEVVIRRIQKRSQVPLFPLPLLCGFLWQVPAVRCLSLCLDSVILSESVAEWRGAVEPHGERRMGIRDQNRRLIWKAKMVG
mmetsp:Transcript_10212/g.19797  ORF Transcript_10212/g.19797 Transcript_10212/m.19797 type:complete len:86 (-) Transcript_10212:428-685(-)